MFSDLMNLSIHPNEAFGAVSFTTLIDGFSVITEIMNGPLGNFYIESKTILDLMPSLDRY